MSVNIDLGNAKVSGNGRLLNNAHIHANTDIAILANGIQIDGNATVFENMEIHTFFDELQNQMHDMDIDSAEYQSMQQIIATPEQDRKTIVKMIIQHVKEFSTGVLQNVLATYISQKF